MQTRTDTYSICSVCRHSTESMVEALYINTVITLHAKILPMAAVKVMGIYYCMTYWCMCWCITGRQ